MRFNDCGIGVSICRWCLSTKRNQSSSVPFTYSATKWPSFDNKIKLEKKNGRLQHNLRRFYCTNGNASRCFFFLARRLGALCLLMMAAMLFARREKRSECAAGEHKQIAEWTKFFEAMLLDRESLQNHVRFHVCVCEFRARSAFRTFIFLFGSWSRFVRQEACECVSWRVNSAPSPNLSKV